MRKLVLLTLLLSTPAYAAGDASTRQRLSSRSASACSRKRCARMRGKATLRMQLGEVAKAKPAVAIGSYPFFDPQHGPNTNVVPRARDAHKLAQAKRAEEVLERVPWAQSS
jgi:hypothetical protein